MQAHKQGNNVNKEKDGVRKSKHLGPELVPVEEPPTHPSSA